MKSRLLPLALLSAALCAPAFSSSPTAPKTIPAYGYWASSITVDSWQPLLRSTVTRSIAAGTARAAVLSLLGSPLQQLTPDVYVYDNCLPDQSVARDRGCVILVVTFAEDRVASLKFVNPSAATILAKNLREETRPKPGSGTDQAKGRAFAVPNR